MISAQTPRPVSVATAATAGEGGRPRAKARGSTRAVLFDMDGVITNTMPYHFASWRYAFSTIGIAVSRLDIYTREGLDSPTTLRQIMTGRGLPYDPRLVAKLVAAKQNHFKKHAHVRFVKGARPFLRQLAARRVILALVTGTSRHEFLKILPRTLRALFTVIITGDEVRRGKPDPEPFRTALERLGIGPAEAVVIENAPFGIRSAKGAGIRCIALETSLPRRYLAGADRIVKSFDALKRIEPFSEWVRS